MSQDRARITLEVQPLTQPRPGLRVIARDTEGHTGTGEGFPLKLRDPEDLPAAIATLKNVISRGQTPAHYISLATLKNVISRGQTPTYYSFSGGALDAAGRLLGAEQEAWGARRFPVATFALESALLDLMAARTRRPVHALLCTLLEDGARAPQTLPAPRPGTLRFNALLPDTPLPDLLRAAEEALRAGLHTLKVKIGRRPFEDDLHRLTALRDSVGPGPKLRADANGAWSVTQAPGHLEALAPLGLEYVEQPVPAADLPELPASPVPVAADESLASEAIVARLEQTRRAAVWVLKPGALGLARSIELARRARACGAELVITHAADGPIAGSFAFALALALAHFAPDALRACGVAPASEIA